MIRRQFLRVLGGIPFVGAVMASVSIAGVADQPRNTTAIFDDVANSGDSANVQSIVGHSADIGSIVLADGQIAWCSDKRELRLGDGVTPGGHKVGGL